jgi:putative ABC transport system permease protein
VSTVFVRLSGRTGVGGGLSELARVVEDTLLRRHLGVKNFRVQGQDAGQDMGDTILLIIRVLLLGTGLLSLFVGGINIMNIMLVTVTERTREIGLRRAIGASPRAILLQFLLEAVIVALGGALIGVAGGLGLAGALALVLDRVLGSWTFHVDGGPIVAAFALALITGVGFGLFPAWRASRLQPVSALRHE